jgi:hypothetical protein
MFSSMQWKRSRVDIPKTLEERECASNHMEIPDGDSESAAGNSPARFYSIRSTWLVPLTAVSGPVSRKTTVWSGALW